jgi:hypothetical protein
MEQKQNDNLNVVSEQNDNMNDNINNSDFDSLDKKKLLKRNSNKKYYEKNKTAVNKYVVEYITNRRHEDPEYKEKYNLYYKNKYDEVARQKKKEYYLKRKQMLQSK